MERLLSELIKNNALLTILVTALTVIYTNLTVILFKRNKNRKLNNENAFYETLIGGLRSGMINTMEDVINVYKATFDLSTEDLEFRYSLSKYLRRTLIIILNRKNKFGGDEVDNNIVAEWKDKITEFISYTEKTSPYADLPVSERNILNDISEFMINNNMEASKRKLEELVSLILARNETLKKITDINKWTVPLSIIGVVLTIIFGFISIFK